MAHDDIRLLTVPSNPTVDASDVVRGADGLARYPGLARNLVAELRGRAETDAEAEAVVELGGPRLTYRQLWERAERVAGGLAAAGLRPGDRAAIMHPNGVDWVLALAGCLLAGVIAVPVNTRFAADEVDYVLGDSGAAYVFRAGEALPDGDPAPGGVSVIADPEPTDVAVIFYTSGTTGAPKGALTTHESILTNAETGDRAKFGGDDPAAPVTRTLICVPLFHVTGCIAQLFAALHVGGCAVIMPALNIPALLGAIAAERITVLVAVPAIYAMMLAAPEFAATDRSSVRLVGYGGAPMPPSVIAGLRRGFPGVSLTNGFGLSETAAAATNLPDEYADEHPDSVGFRSPVIDLALLPIDDDGDLGELLMRGPSITPGYWNKPEANADAFVDGWFRTGDIARVGADGLVSIVDRAKDMINRGGENVYSVEVENALAGAPGVFESAVVGVPNAVFGETVGAVLVPIPGAEVDPAAVLDYLQGRIADFKIPQYIHVRTAPLPRNPGGKILKKPLREIDEWGERLH